MRKLLESTRVKLGRFIEQRQASILVVRAADHDTAILLKLLRDLDEASSEDLFVLVGGVFSSAEAWVDLALRNLAEEHGLASRALLEAGKPALRPFPEEARDERRPPRERLRCAVQFTQQLLPGEARCLVWAFAPESIADPLEYWSLLSGLWPRGPSEPWLGRLRLVVRDGLAPGRDPHPLRVAGQGRVQETRVDFGQAAVAQALAEEVQDEALPMEARVQAKLSLAILDSAHGRFVTAMDGFNYLLAYFQTTQNLMLQALVMSCMGDVFSRTESFDTAQHWYECALGAAVDSKSPVLIASVIRSLGSFALARGSYAEAAQYFEALDQIAGKLLDAETKAFALEQRGLSQEKLARPELSIRSWEAAVKLGRATDQPHTVRANLRHLQRVYREAGFRERAAAIELELIAAGQEGTRYA